MTAYLDKSLSLVERKKLQWAKEREELSKLNTLWGRETHLLEKAVARARNAAKLSSPKQDYLLRDSPTSQNRKPSLPPLYQNQNFTYSNEKVDKEMGGETSGYGSDNLNHSPVHFQNPTWNNSTGYESSSSSREDRPKWGDRGVHIGKFWEPKQVDDYAKPDEPPGWVKRGLERKTELIVSNMSPAESPEQHDLDRERPCTSSSGSQNKSYIRGQNAPVEPTELAERERKRQIALAHQEAIRQQLEEREQKRREEKERRLQEEREEELRIERQRELEKQRKEREQKLLEEKIERERKRKEALKEALELAEKKAKEEKMKQKLSKQLINMNIKENNVEKERRESPRPDLIIINNVAGEGVDCKDQNKVLLNNSVQNNLKEDSFNSRKILNDNKDEDNLNKTYNVNVANNQEKHLDENKTEKYANQNISNNNAININNNNDSNLTNVNVPQVPPISLQQLPTTSSSCGENMALVLQTPIETLQNMQFAVLMPTSGTGAATALPIAVPIALATDRNSTSRTENRILTPTLYRNNKKLCDSSTQTDFQEFIKSDYNDQREKYVRDKFNNLEISRRRLRSDERSRDTVEERPKWNANRPPTRYLKQSEKDPLYQRRKRQKQRQIKMYEDKIGYSAHSSDDSQTASPRTYRKRGYIEKRQGRALWRKNEHMFAQNVRVFQTEILPLESDKDRIYYKTKSGHDCCCSCRCQDKHKYNDHIKVVDILKIERNSPGDRYKSEMINVDRLPECTNTNTSLDSSSEMLDKNDSRNSLAPNQNNWESTTATPSIYSPRGTRRNSEN